MVLYVLHNELLWPVRLSSVLGAVHAVSARRDHRQQCANAVRLRRMRSLWLRPGALPTQGAIRNVPGGILPDARPLQPAGV